MAKGDAHDADNGDRQEDGDPASYGDVSRWARLGGQINSGAIAELYASLAANSTKNLGAQLLASLGSTPVLDAKTLAGISSVVSSYAFSDFPKVSALVRHIVEAPALTKPQDYTGPDPSTSGYSDRMVSPSSYFREAEAVITSFDGLHAAITKLIAKTVDLPLVWRGVKNAQWGLHSALYRHLMGVNGVIPPSGKPRTAQRYPDENQMVEAEQEILRIARRDWRFDDFSALETFARIQHAGGPTRLIDVTKNPYIGAWFAVEYDEREESNDARLFAIATKPVAREGKEPAPDSTLELNELGASRDPFWHMLANSLTRQQFDWGTGARRRVWVPPAYDPRISAQNAAFILDGVPMTSSRTASYFKYDRDRTWRRADLLASASIYAKMHRPTRTPSYNARNFAPTFSFRIEASAKSEIREVMESRFGYRRSYIYPDMAALGAYLRTCRLAE